MSILLLYSYKKLFSLKLTATAVVTHLRDNYNTHPSPHFKVVPQKFEMVLYATLAREWGRGHHKHKMMDMPQEPN